tara:strand:+ start:235 stop:534 length:300 start_codon:yes stop_codon:yes gene_type:complete
LISRERTQQSACVCYRELSVCTRPSKVLDARTSVCTSAAKVLKIDDTVVVREAKQKVAVGDECAYEKSCGGSHPADLEARPRSHSFDVHFGKEVLAVNP